MNNLRKIIAGSSLVSLRTKCVRSMQKVSFLAIIVLLLILGSCDKKIQNTDVNVIPQPSNLRLSSEYFTVKSKMKIVLQSDSEELKTLGEYLAMPIRKITGFEIPIMLYDDAREVDEDIVLSLYEAETKNDEAYQIRMSKNSVSISSTAGNGLFYGIQTFMQLIPSDLLMLENAGKIKIPSVIVNDKPRFKYRGMHLDVSRHFFSKEFILKFIDVMAMYKFNTFHWHLTDDNGWRLEIKKYPLLTEVCAWRVDHENQPWRDRDPQGLDEKATYGGFYTQDEVREVIKYAQSKYIKIIPEIEMPGHTSEVFAAYPELSCTGKKLNVIPGSYWPNTDIFCAGKEETFAFIQNVLDEVIELFPSEYIHIGGDEADKTEWEKCPLCQKRMRDEGLKNEHELQSYFIKRIEKYLVSKGKKMIGWDEILEGGLAPEATVMSWRGMQGGIDAAKQGHDVIMTPVSHCYFDYYQADPEFEPKAIGGFTSLKKVYFFEPIPPELTEEEAKHVLGAQANIWTEFIPTPEHAEYMAMPRMLALSEVVWTPKKKRKWRHFNRKLQTHFKILDNKNINYSKGSYKVNITSEADTSGIYNIKLDSEIWKAKIYYTLDGSEPDTTSTFYTDIFEISKTTTIKAGVFVDGKLIEKASVQTINIHKALGKEIKLTHTFSHRYTGGSDKALIDGVQGGNIHHNGLWQGFSGKDLEAVIDLGKLTEFSHLEAGFFQREASWIFFPTAVEFYISNDGKTYTLLANIPCDVSPKDTKAARKQFVISSSEKHKSRYVKVVAKNLGVCPPWHRGAGDEAWLFADEIIIE